MRVRHRVACMLLLSAGGMGELWAQGDAAASRHDYQQWFSADVEYDPSRNLSLDAQYVLRNYGFLQRFKGSYYYLQARYAIGKHWYPDAQVRYVNTFDQDLFRIETGLQYRYRTKKNMFSYRIGWFNERKQLLPDDKLQLAPNNYLRNRIRYRRDLPKHLQASVSVEAYTKLDVQGPDLKRMAYVANLTRKLENNREVYLEYLFQPEYHEVGRKRMSSLTLGFSWDLTPARYHRKSNHGRNDR